MANGPQLSLSRMDWAESVRPIGPSSLCNYHIARAQRPRSLSKHSGRASLSRRALYVRNQTDICGNALWVPLLQARRPGTGMNTSLLGPGGAQSAPKAPLCFVFYAVRSLRRRSLFRIA
jgi:hypothetical protein